MMLNFKGLALTVNSMAWVKAKKEKERRIRKERTKKVKRRREVPESARALLGALANTMPTICASPQ